MATLWCSGRVSTRKNRLRWSWEDGSVLPHVQAWAGRVKEAIDTENRTGSRPRCHIARAGLERTAALSSRSAAKILGVSATTLRRLRAEASRFSNR